eukprot:Seg2266.3 transcript_id=Seg2266.3/GoldUCD/mRNA.D3Y31 product="Leucine-rich repeat protein SHOC-2" protein_id=Seg2266.3/GoldUCD/D3Y31
MAAINDTDSPKEENKEALNLINAAKALNSKKLDLSKRRIMNIPTELQSLQQLEFLYLEGNLLQTLPEELFTCLHQLKWLDLRNNKLLHLPSSIKEARLDYVILLITIDRKDKAMQHASTNISPSPNLRLPPIEQSNSINIDAAAPEKAPNISVSMTGRSKAKSPEKPGRKHEKIKLEKLPSNRIEEAISPKDRPLEAESKSARKPTKSPNKKSPKRKMKSKVVKSKVPEAKTIMNAKIKESGMVEMDYKVLADEKSLDDKEQIERLDTTVMNEQVKEIMDEEKAKMNKVRELIEAQTISEVRPSKSKNALVDLKEIAIDDMVVIKVPEKHFIPGQPCLGKIVSLPDATGLLLIHYFSGSYDGEWRPMMSRSSPYLRKVPASRIVFKFKFDEGNKIRAEDVRKIKELIDETED